MPKISDLSVDSVELHDVRIRLEEVIPVHTQDTWEFNLVLKGRGMCTIGTRTEPFEEGGFIVIPPNVPHGLDFDPKSAGRDGTVKNIALFVSPPWLKRAAGFFPALAPDLKRFLARTAAFMLSPADRIEMAKRLKELCTVEKHFLPLAALEFVCRIERCAGILPLADTTIPPAWEEARLAETRIYISCNYMRKISLPRAARHAGMSRSRFCAFFKKATGTTFIHAVNACRIEEACRLLTTTTLSITEIATRVGYPDSPYFNRQFKKFKKLSPLAWRKAQS